MTHQISPDGWFTDIGGQPVTKIDLTSRLPGSAMPWAFGHPIGLLWHYTSGNNGDISGSMIADGFITAQMSIGRDGRIYQYADIWTAHWHAFDASRWGIGVEHEANPPGTDLTDVQMATSALVFAAIIESVKDHFGFDIPVVRVPGCDLTHPGIKEHHDGLGCSWDPHGHSDGLFGKYNWTDQMAAINAALQGGDDVGYTDFVAGMDYRRDHPNDPMPAGKGPDFARGWTTAKLRDQKPGPPGPKGDPGPQGPKGEKGDKGDGATLAPGTHLVVSPQ